jgi:thiol-disulfide isomerase/thioredoxin
MLGDPFAGRRQVRRPEAATTNDRTVVGRLTATAMLLACLALAACQGGDPDGGRAGPGSTAPGEGLGSRPLVQRTPAQFQDDLAALKGRVVVVNFWASWCLPCRAEMPALQRVSRSYAEAGRPVTFVGVDSSDVRSAAADFLAKSGVTYPTVYDKDGINGGVATRWSVTSLPQTWFVARDGSRAARIPRPLTEAELRERIDQLLAVP